MSLILPRHISTHEVSKSDRSSRTRCPPGVRDPPPNPTTGASLTSFGSALFEPAVAINHESGFDFSMQIRGWQQWRGWGGVLPLTDIGIMRRTRTQESGVSLQHPGARLASLRCMVASRWGSQAEEPTSQKQEQEFAKRVSKTKKNQ